MNATVGQQLADCRALCTGLSCKMDDLTELAEEMYTEDDTQGTKIVSMLVDARNVLTYVMMMLDGE